jgi:hypothetical protein
MRIVLLSAFVTPEVELDARRRGADLVLRKPKPLQQLAENILDLLEGAA